MKYQVISRSCGTNVASVAACDMSQTNIHGSRDEQSRVQGGYVWLLVIQWKAIHVGGMALTSGRSRGGSFPRSAIGAPERASPSFLPSFLPCQDQGCKPQSPCSQQSTTPALQWTRRSTLMNQREVNTENTMHPAGPLFWCTCMHTLPYKCRSVHCDINNPSLQPRPSKSNHHHKS
jgi:hypothetical protein